jgi:hypothetical protein
MARSSLAAALAVLSALAATLAGQELADLLASARPVGAVLAIDNDYVRVDHVVLDYPAAERRVAEARPVLLYIRVTPGPGVLNTRLLAPPRGAAPSWRPGVVPRAVHIQLLKPPPPPRDLEEPGADPPSGAEVAREWNGGRLLLAVFRSLRYGFGTGRFPSVTTFLSDGTVEVSSRGLRRRMGVQAGDAFWFEGATRLTVMSDEPVGAAIVQLYPP